MDEEKAIRKSAREREETLRLLKFQWVGASGDNVKGATEGGGAAGGREGAAGGRRGAAGGRGGAGTEGAGGAACLLVCLFIVLLPWSPTQWAASYLRSSSGLSCFWPWQLTLLNGSPVAP